MRGVLLLVLLALLAAACGGASAAEDVGTVTERVRQDDVADERPPTPEIAGTTLDGQHLDLASLDGPIVLNFWASWCGPCVSEAPHLAAISEAYEGRAHVVGVNLDTSETNARTFERDHGIPFPSIHDPSKQIASALGRSGPAGVPTTLVLDADHRVASRLLGAVTARELAPRLDALLKEAGVEEAGVEEAGVEETGVEETDVGGADVGGAGG